MSVLAVLLALLLEQARPSLPITRLRLVYAQWLDGVSRNFDAGSTRHASVVWVLGVLLPVVAVAALAMVTARFSLLLAFALHVGVLYLTLGFRQFSHHFTGIRDALDQGDETRARALLAQWQGVDASELPRTELLRQVIEYAVLASHRLVFGVMFWYVLLAALGLGPAGAVLYRLAQLALQHWGQQHPIDAEPMHPRVLDCARSLWRAVDYLPVRLTAFGFAIVGNFEEAVAAWRRDTGVWADANDGIVLAAAAGAIGVQLGQAPGRTGPVAPATNDAVVDGLADRPDEDATAAAGLTGGSPPQPGHLQSLVGLVWRSTILWILLLTLLSIANLIG